MDLRPQAHEIIRTWLFSTVVRSHFEHDSLPWTHAAISGWVLDPDRKKMSKSKGNVVTPKNLLDQYGSDAVRYWASSARLGVDTAFDEGQLRIGRKLAIKILNAAADLVEKTTRDFDSYEQARALERAEKFFWSFCDNYLELVKSRRYGNEGDEAAASANRALTTALSAQLRLLAPHLPFVTEEVWSWWQEGSIHRASWPVTDELSALADEVGPLPLEVASTVLAEVRKAKTEAKVSLRTEVETATVRDSASRLEALRLVAGDVESAGKISNLEMVEDSTFGVDVVLAVEDAAG
jgi:valyl-tRNA synthetase